MSNLASYTSKTSPSVLVSLYVSMLIIFLRLVVVAAKVRQITDNFPLYVIFVVIDDANMPNFY